MNLKNEKSCGAIIYRKKDNNIKYLLIRQKNGEFWGFPKGHIEENETEKETAEREIFEETGLKGVFHESFREEIGYIIENRINKTVVYFLLEIKTKDEEKYQKEEIMDYKWVEEKEAINTITFEEQKKVFIKAIKLLEDN